MKLKCKRDKTKERALLKTNSADDFLRMLNRNNIQHFTYDTDTRKLTFTHNCGKKEIDLSITSVAYLVVDIDDICLITNKNNEIDTFIKVQRAFLCSGTHRCVPSGGIFTDLTIASFDQWILNKAGFKHRSHAELSMQIELKQKENIQNQIKELTKKLESYV